jgi:hypothetical protein
MKSSILNTSFFGHEVESAAGTRGNIEVGHAYIDLIIWIKLGPNADLMPSSASTSNMHLRFALWEKGRP